MTDQVHFARVDSEGRIIQRGTCSRRLLFRQSKNLTEEIIPWIDWEPGMSSVSHWWNGSKFSIRPVLTQFDKLQITSDGIDTSTLSNLPIPCVVYVDDSSIVVNDGVLELVADTPGEYEIEINHFPFRPFKQKVVAV